MSKSSKTIVVNGLRRRGRTETRTVKKSFTLHEDVVMEAESAVRDGEAENLSAFVEEAVTEKLRRGKRARLYEAYQEAARDTEFEAEMRVVSTEFDASAADGFRED